MSIEVLSIIVLFVSFFALLLLKVPVAYSIGISTTLSLLMNIDNMPGITTIAQRMTTGIDSFALLAIPFFILAGEIMKRGGIANRLINFARRMNANARSKDDPNKDTTNHKLNATTMEAYSELASKIRRKKHITPEQKSRMRKNRQEANNR